MANRDMDEIPDEPTPGSRENIRGVGEDEDDDEFEDTDDLDDEDEEDIER